MSALAYRHQRVQRLRRLVGRRSARKAEGRFVVEGANLLEEVLSSGVPVEAVYVDSGWAGASPGPPVDALAGASPEQARQPERLDQPDRLEVLLARCFDSGARVFELEPGVLARVAGTVTPQPVMAVVEMPGWRMSDIERHLAEVERQGPQFVVVCVDVRDPGNAGTVVRSAWAAGATAVVCCEGTVDPWNPKAVRASAGAVVHVPVVAAGEAAATLDEVGGWGLWRWGTVAEGGCLYDTADLAQPCALVLGNEAAGLPLGGLRPHLDGLISIPMAGGAESLNVGMAAAVVCFEAGRQRRHRPHEHVRAVAPASRGWG
ncbi:MAG: TrmH family RNA methyltransferase [Acidimicrobiales bacterium]